MIQVSWIGTVSSIVGGLVALSTLLTIICKPIRTKVKKSLAREIRGEYESFIDNFRESHLTLLKTEITNLFFQFWGKGRPPDYARKSMVSLYEIYKKLGGNSYIDELFREFMDMK